MPAEPLLTFDEVTAHLRVSRGWLQAFLKKHPHYLRVGRQYRFTEGHLQQIIAAMEAPAAAVRERRRAVPADLSEAEVVRRLERHFARHRTRRGRGKGNQ